MARLRQKYSTMVDEAARLDEAGEERQAVRMYRRAHRIHELLVRWGGAR